MVFAFDWGGVLDSNESVRKLANDAYAGGNEVHIVSGQPVPPWCDVAAKAREVGLPRGTQVHIVLDDFRPPEVAKRKQEVLKQIYACIFFDDVQDNIEAAMAIGVFGVWVQPGKVYSYQAVLKEFLESQESK